jgi:hypothetical protein
MDNAALDLTLCQLLKISEASRKNKQAYSDRKKEKFHDEIDALIGKISSTNLSTLDDGDQYLLKKLFDLLFIWFEFLDNSTLNNIPYEIIRCLDAVLEEWLGPADANKFVIVTSLQSQQLSFSYYDSEFALDKELTLFLENKFQTKIESAPVPINLPKYLVHDYLANVTLYHELGHFIDRHRRITESIIDSEYFQELKQRKKARKQNHFAEYFADIFAAQYLDEKCAMYLEYCAIKEPECFTHPSTESRVKIVTDFLAGSTDFTIEQLKKGTERATLGRQLTPKRYLAIDGDDFDDLLPCKIENQRQLHYLFIKGWQAWGNEESNLAKTFTYSADRYRVINNLIEKSISNFIVQEKWEQAKLKLSSDVSN